MVFCETNGGVTQDRVVEEDLLITILDPQKCRQKSSQKFGLKLNL